MTTDRAPDALSGFSPAWWAGHDHAASGGITAPDDMPDEFYEGMEAWLGEQRRREVTDGT